MKKMSAQNDNKPPKKHSKISFKLVFIIAIIGAFVGIFLQSLTHQSSLETALLNKDIPQFSLPSLTDSTHYISNQDMLKDAPLLLNVWASWCAPCRNEHKIISKLAQKHNVTIYGLNYKDTPENGQKFLTRYGNPFAQVMNDQEGLATLNWGIRGVPESFIINKQGKIIHRHTGEIRQKDIEKLLKFFQN